MLMAEIERRPKHLSTNPLVTQGVLFADTLLTSSRYKVTPTQVGALVMVKRCILQANKDGHNALKRVRKFGLESLYSHFFPTKTYPGM